MNTSLIDVPNELIELILSKCPLKSAIRCTSVSKSWQSMVSSPRFSRIHHMEQSKLPENQNKFLIWAKPGCSYDDRVYLIGSEDGKVRIESWSGYPPENLVIPVCSCDGLILLQKKFKCGLVLWNPSMSKHIIISQKSKSYGFRYEGHNHLYYDSVSEDYKIVCVYKDWYAVYSCKSGSWGEREDFPCDRIVCSEASVDGCMYGMSKQRECGILSIMCFDVRDGKVHEFPMPEGAECLDLVQLDVVSGRLCLYGFTKDGGGLLQLWVMERNNGYRCRSWRKLMSMKKQGILSDIHHQTFPICLSNEDDVVLWSNRSHFIYNSRRKSLQKANFTWEISHNCFPYQENLYLMP